MLNRASLFGKRRGLSSTPVSDNGGTGFDAELMGLALRQWRLERNESQGIAGEGSGLVQTTISAMEKGESLRPQNLAKLLAYYGENMESLAAKVREIEGWPESARRMALRAARSLPEDPPPRPGGTKGAGSAGKKARGRGSSKA